MQSTGIHPHTSIIIFWYKTTQPSSSSGVSHPIHNYRHSQLHPCMYNHRHLQVRAHTTIVLFRYILHRHCHLQRHPHTATVIFSDISTESSSSSVTSFPYTTIVIFRYICLQPSSFSGISPHDSCHFHRYLHFFIFPHQQLSLSLYSTFPHKNHHL
jgi:hypothetical protein